MNLEKGRGKGGRVRGKGGKGGIGLGVDISGFKFQAKTVKWAL